MNPTDLPDPITPADCDLRDFAFMPLDIIRLFSSEFHALSTDTEWRAGVTLWLKSFHQVPAASLPDDDIQLARLAELGRDVKGWKAMRTGALRGWVKCADGRLYHPVVAEKALDAWGRKLVQRERSKRGNDARWGKRDHPANESQEVQGVHKDAERMVEHHPQSIPQGVPQGSQGTGTGTGTGTEIGKEIQAPRKRAAPGKPAVSSAADLVADGLDQELAAGFIGYRKTVIRQPLTPMAWGLIKTEAAKAGVTPTEAVSEIVSRGWRGFKAEWMAQRPQTPAQRRGAPQQSTDDRDAESMRLLGFLPARTGADCNVIEG